MRNNAMPIHDPAYQAALHFVRHEAAFHLGFLPTEQSHPTTEDFSRIANEDTKSAIDRIFAVDADLAPVARRVVMTEGFDRLVAAIRSVAFPSEGETSREGSSPRVCFSGCGSTGRLAIMLEAMWRYAFAELPAIADRAASIMTGGDRALIRAVENFEDFMPFGARQVSDLGLASGDVFIAVSEGGETSSVIGTALEAARLGCVVFFVYNNPTRLLTEEIERSRTVIEHPQIEALDLFSGPMALSGSTRMQATSLELLCIGIAMEEAVGNPGAQRVTENSENNRTIRHAATYRLQRVDAYVRLLNSLRSQPNRRTLATLASNEAKLYHEGGRLTYFADDFLLDIFSDTTERSPTFMTPPFRAVYDDTSPVSWAFAKNPSRTTKSAWHHMLRRPPRGITWTSKDYEALEAPKELVDAPPHLDTSEIHSYLIGRDTDESRWKCPRSLALWIDVDGSLNRAGNGDESTIDGIGRTLQSEQFSAHESLSVMSTIGDNGNSVSNLPERIARKASVEHIIQADIASSPVRLFHHLAIKLILNTVSTTSMALLRRIEGNWMIQLNPTNKKLVDRGTRIIADLAGLDYEQACIELHRTMQEPHRASVDGVSASESAVVSTLRRLRAHKTQGSVR